MLELRIILFTSKMKVILLFQRTKSNIYTRFELSTLFILSSPKTFKSIIINFEDLHLIPTSSHSNF